MGDLNCKYRNLYLYRHRSSDSDDTQSLFAHVLCCAPRVMLMNANYSGKGQRKFKAIKQRVELGRSAAPPSRFFSISF